MKKKSITISEKLKLNKEQYELDFVNIYLDKDLPLFIDPWAIRQWNDQVSINSHNLISHFFEYLLDLIKNQDKSNAINILDWLHEPSETNLGLSKKGKWLAIWKWQANDIYEKLLASKAIKTWLISDLEDTALMIDWIKEDKISDIVTNIIRWELIKYTQNQCILHWINLRKNTITWFYWDIEKNDWISNRTDMLIIDNKPILLIPKHFVTKNLSINYDNFYNFDILEFEQRRHLDMGSSLCRSIKWEIKAPFKNVINDEIKVNKKEYIYTFSKDNPEVLEEYKRNNL